MKISKSWLMVVAITAVGTIWPQLESDAGCNDADGNQYNIVEVSSPNSSYVIPIGDPDGVLTGLLDDGWEDDAGLGIAGSLDWDGNGPDVNTAGTDTYTYTGSHTDDKGGTCDVTGSVEVTVVEVVSVALADSSVTCAEAGTTVSMSDLTIVTNPSGYESESFISLDSATSSVSDSAAHTITVKCGTDSDDCSIIGFTISGDWEASTASFSLNEGFVSGEISYIGGASQAGVELEWTDPDGNTYQDNQIDYTYSSNTAE